MGLHDFFGGGGFGAQQDGLGTSIQSLFGGFGGAGGEAAHNNPETSQLGGFGAGLGGGLMGLLNNMKFAYSDGNTALTIGGQQNQQGDQERLIRQLQQMFDSTKDGSGGASAPKTVGYTISPGKNPVTTTPLRVVGPQYEGPQFGGPQFGGQQFGNRVF